VCIRAENESVDIKKSLKIPKGGNQNPYIEEEQTTQWPKEKVLIYRHLLNTKALLY
jgi:hypothetical protein